MARKSLQMPRENASEMRPIESLSTEVAAIDK